MIIAFKLSMPNLGSWDGRWSGEGKCHVIVRSFRKPPTDPDGQPIAGRHFHYDFGDGWSAGVTADPVDSGEARRLRRRSDGFCGYDWMVDSIIQQGRIQPRSAST